MENLQKYKNKKIAIYGMGLTGKSVANKLKKLGAKVFCWDDDNSIRKKIRNNDLSKFWLEKNLNNIVVSPGININECKAKKFLKKNQNKIITDLDIFFQLNRRPAIISITGTNGKSTTCKIVEKILRTAKFNVSTIGNIGNPVLLAKKTNEKKIIILEVSSYQLQYSKLFRSKHAAILNITPDHLERHGNIKNYAKIKSKIFFAQKKSDYTYINAKNKYSKLIKKIFKLKKIKSKLIFIDKSNLNFLMKKIKNRYFKSGANIENLAFAYKIAKKFKISDKKILRAINSFKGLPHRQEIVLSKKKMICINDSKATSFDASLQSLLNYDKIYWLLGGIPKHGDSFNLKKVKNKVIKAYIVGRNILFFKKQLNKIIPHVSSKNMKIAINKIYKDIKFEKGSKKTILLSPAAASFDQYKNFENRGNHFRSLVVKKFK